MSVCVLLCVCNQEDRDASIESVMRILFTAACELVRVSVCMCVCECVCVCGVVWCGVLLLTIVCTFVCKMGAQIL